MRNRLLYVALRLAVRLLPYVPLKMAHTAAAGGGTLAYYVLPAARRAILQNLSIALPEHTVEARKWIARRAFRNDALNWLDTLRIPSLSAEQIVQMVPVQGWKRLEQALELGEGTILVSMHLGNFDLVGQVIAAQGWQLTVPVERIEPPELFNLLTRWRQSQGIRLLPVDEAPRAILRAISRGEIAGLTADRHVAGKSITLDFFGQPAVLPRGPASLARRTGAPLLVGIGVRRPDGGFEGFITPPVPTERTSDATADEERITRAVVAIMEEFVRRYPDQWLAFSPVWQPGIALNGPATIEQQTEAAV